MPDDYADFEETGEQTVRKNLARGSYNPRRASLAAEWLRSLDASREAAKDARASRIAQRASTIATIALIVAVASAIKPMVELVSMVILWIRSL